jgi:hypothetical protein
MGPSMPFACVLRLARTRSAGPEGEASRRLLRQSTSEARGASCRSGWSGRPSLCWPSHCASLRLRSRCGLPTSLWLAVDMSLTDGPSSLLRSAARQGPPLQQERVAQDLEEAQHSFGPPLPVNVATLCGAAFDRSSTRFHRLESSGFWDAPTRSQMSLRSSCMREEGLALPTGPARWEALAFG